MIRFVFLFSILASPLAAQTSLTERPGRWISVTRSETPAPVLEAPSSGPLLPVEPAPVIELSAPEEVTLIAPPRTTPNTRPVPRPRALEVAVAPDVAFEVLEVAAPVAEILPEVVAEPPVEIATAPDTRPQPRPQTDETVALAEMLAAQIASDALAIVAAAPRDLPLNETFGEMFAVETPSFEGTADPVDVSELASAVTTAEAAVIEVAARAPAPDTTAPRVMAALLQMPLSTQPSGVSAVLLPSAPMGERPHVVSTAFNAPSPGDLPILPRLRPSGPASVAQLVAMTAPRPTPLSAVLLPQSTARPLQLPRLARAAAPMLDPFPRSALPPEILSEGPENLDQVVQPDAPFAEVNAAVLMTGPDVAPAHVLPLLAPFLPSRGEAPADPDVAVQLPEPDLGALARMVDDAMICWRLADLSPEAQWARLSVDVALDETNMPAAASIRLTGFAHVVSSAAEDAYRAAHSALMGCAEASNSAPATSSATLLFDHTGVRLR